MVASEGRWRGGHRALELGSEDGIGVVCAQKEDLGWREQKVPSFCGLSMTYSLEKWTDQWGSQAIPLPTLLASLLGAVGSVCLSVHLLAVPLYFYSIPTALVESLSLNRVCGCRGRGEAQRCFVL